MSRLLPALASVLALLGSAAPALAQEPGAVIVHVDNVRSSEGHVRVELCTQGAFLTDACAVAGSAPARRGETVVTLGDVPPGVYAVQVYHDANDDHKVNRGLLGIPTEDIGFSREAPLGLHGPQFIKAAFNHAADEQVLTVHLRHF
jgi:uncharacterized protein (DUF2141 family)